MTATVLLTRKYLSEYGRRPINVVLIVAVPLIFVTLAAGAIADFAAVVGGVGDTGQLAAPTAGWAAAFLAGVAGFFHVLGSRQADRRLALAGMGPNRIMLARIGSGLVLGLLAAGAAIGALAIRTGITDPFRVVAGTAMFAIIYLGIGVAIGTLVRSEVNGSLVVIFVWMLDVFLGPAMAGGQAWITRLFPSHFVTLVTLNTASGHAGPVGDLGWALVWTVGALGFAGAVFRYGSATRQGVRRPILDGRWARIIAGLRYGLRDYRRNPAMWVLLLLLPVFFITLSFWVTPSDPTPVELTEAGSRAVQIISMAEVHGAIMVPITIAFLAGLAGLFVVQGSLEADARLVLAGFRPWEVLVSRLGVVALAGILTTVVSLLVTSIDFAPVNWAWFTVGNVLVAFTYGLVGVLVGARFGRLGGLYMMFLLPFIDVGLAQNIMFSAAPPSWGAALPGRGSVSVLIDAAFTPTFDQVANLVLAGGWLVGLAVLTGLEMYRIAQPRRA